MKYFMDTEFSEYDYERVGDELAARYFETPTIDLISIGIVAEDGREYYAESHDFDINGCNLWVEENILPKLGPWGQRKTRAQIAKEILAFVGDDKRPEFWGYFADYDWVVFCWLYGRMIDLPKHLPHYCRDLRQFMDHLGVQRDELPPNPDNEHHALADARWIRDAYRHLVRTQSPFVTFSPVEDQGDKA